MTDRFIIDDCGTLIDTYNRNTYDYISDIVPLLNEHEKTFKRFNDKITELHWENHQLTTRIETIKNTIEEAYQTERTELGRSVLKQLLEKIQ